MEQNMELEFENLSMALEMALECTPDSRQLVKQRYLKQTPFRTVLEIYSQELNAASSCCTPSQ